MANRKSVENTGTFFWNSIIVINDQIKMKSSLYSRYYAEVSNEWWGRFRGWTPRKHKNVAEVERRWRHCVKLARSGNRIQRPPTSIAMSLTPRLTGRLWKMKNLSQIYHPSYDNPQAAYERIPASKPIFEGLETWVRGLRRRLNLTGAGLV